MLASLFRLNSNSTIKSFGNFWDETRRFSTNRLLNLNDLSNIPGSKKKRKRWGRGIGSGRGKNSGFGHQKSRSTPRAFEGGQTPFYKTHPKIGFHNSGGRELLPINLGTIQEFIDKKRLDPKNGDMVTMKDLLLSGMFSSAADGIKLLAKGKEDFRTPINLEVSAASEEAIRVVESVGGTVTCAHFNTLALRALLKPQKFELLPRRARPPPKLMNYYLDKSKAGYLSPEIQIRNMKMFGYVTSEEKLREEHDAVMKLKFNHPSLSS